MLWDDVPREVTYRYVDPLAQVWVNAARRIGLRVVRTSDAYAATDGAGTLAIGDDAQLDADDSLAQMIFHELCHSLVEGEHSFHRADWGMDNTGPDHDWREHACLRVQWILAGRHGLRGLFAPTTDFRAFWDTLSGDVLADRTDPSVQAALVAIRRADREPWHPHLATALLASATIAQAAAPSSPRDTLWSTVVASPAAHPTGLPAGESGGTCGSCVWRFTSRGATRCHHVPTKIDAAWPACERYEATATVDCQTCGACCREAYHSVEVSPRDRFVKRHPDLVVKYETRLEVLRTGDRCANLQGDLRTGFACTHYEDRPQTCRDFTLGSDNCLIARRRVGLSL